MSTYHKLPRAVRLDQSDTEVFERAAQPGEWCVPGGFEFSDVDEADLTGRKLQAFTSGFLGLTSFGRTTLAAITRVSTEEFQQTIERLAEHLIQHYGAPDHAAARAAAAQEIAYAESLCEYAEGTLLAVERDLTEDGITEKFKKFIPAPGADWANSRPLVFRTED